MITLYAFEAGRLKPVGYDIARFEDATWIDVLSPTPEEEKALEAATKLDVPTREEMAEIELSARLYTEDDAAFMTANILSHGDADAPVMSQVTFILAGTRLITLRYEDPRPFRQFVLRCAKSGFEPANAEAVLVGLLEAVVERIADFLERTAQQTDEISRSVFMGPENKPGARVKLRSGALQATLEAIGRKGDFTSKIRESLASLQRLVAFLTQITAARKPGKDVEARIRTLYADAQSLSDHAGFLSQKITFLLDATLGLINIEQNGIIKIFSVVAVVFLPPTLIASIYGMNFAHMPELAQPYGYPLALVGMVLSAVLPYILFKIRGWL